MRNVGWRSSARPQQIVTASYSGKQRLTGMPKTVLSAWLTSPLAILTVLDEMKERGEEMEKEEGGWTRQLQIRRGPAKNF